MPAYHETYRGEDVLDDDVCSSIQPFAPCLSYSELEGGLKLFDICLSCGTAVLSISELVSVIVRFKIHATVVPWHRSLQKD